jgi:hypothetical protein
MNLIVGIETGMATQFWIARRLLEAASLLAATFLGAKTISYVRLNFVYFLVTAGIILSIFTKVFPVCYIDGIGLTVFKKIAEHLIIIMGIITLLRLKTLRRHFDLVYVKVIGWAIAFGLAAELLFTLYITVYDIVNGIGHLFYLFSQQSSGRISFVQEGIDKPYTTMFRAGVTKNPSRDALYRAFTTETVWKRWPGLRSNGAKRY